MTSLSLLSKSFSYSILIQVVTGVITIFAFLKPLKDSDRVLQDVLAIEAISQFIELIWYIYIFNRFKKMSNITVIRYIDWFFSTPIMLLSTVLYMEYLNQKQKKPKKVITSLHIIQSNWKKICFMLLCNLFMLVFGLLAELGRKKYTFLTLGFVFYFLSFQIVYEFAKHSTEGLILFGIMLLIWGLYGVAAFYNYAVKNIMYNILDLLAKNFYGLYLFFKIQQI